MEVPQECMIPGIKVLRGMLGYGDLKVTKSLAFWNHFISFSASFKSTDGRNGQELTAWAGDQKHLSEMACDFLQKHGSRFWPSRMTGTDPSSLVYPDDQRKIKDYLTQLFFKHNYQARAQKYRKSKESPAREAPNQTPASSMVPMCPPTTRNGFHGGFGKSLTSRRPAFQPQSKRYHRQPLPNEPGSSRANAQSRLQPMLCDEAAYSRHSQHSTALNPAKINQNQLPPLKDVFPDMFDQNRLLPLGPISPVNASNYREGVSQPSSPDISGEVRPAKRQLPDPGYATDGRKRPWQQAGKSRDAPIVID